MQLINRLRFLLVTLLAVGVVMGCERQATDPCEGVLNEGPLKIVGVWLADEATGEPAVGDGGLEPADITVSGADGTAFNDYVVWDTGAEGPASGAILFHVPEKEGVYRFTIHAGDRGAVTFAYTVGRTASDNPCRPYTYLVSGVNVEGRPSEPLEDDRLSDSVTLLKVAL